MRQWVCESCAVLRFSRIRTARCGGSSFLRAVLEAERKVEALDEERVCCDPATVCERRMCNAKGSVRAEFQDRSLKEKVRTCGGDLGGGRERFEIVEQVHERKLWLNRESQRTQDLATKAQCCRSVLAVEFATSEAQLSKRIISTGRMERGEGGGQQDRAGPGGGLTSCSDATRASRKSQKVVPTSSGWESGFAR
eukprot:2493672-Rhodomonas_salina.1